MLAALLRQRLFKTLIAALLTSGSLLIQQGWNKPILAVTDYCRFTPEAIARKEELLRSALAGDRDAQKQYRATLQQHAEILRQCRARTWPQNQAIWLRLYPCDVRPGSIDGVLDRIVNLGYNKIYLEVFFDSQVLLPPADNPTPWITVARSPGAEKTDLLAQTIKKGGERGLQVYASLYTLNFGYTYAQLPERNGVLARNGKGQNSIAVVDDGSKAFVDPYNRQAQIDYYQLVQAVLKRRPKGVLFDYIRYPQGRGSQSVASRVKDLWIYGDASRQALYQRSKNQKGKALIELFVNQGYITVKDIIAVDKLYPQEKIPLWQGRQPSFTEAKASAAVRQQIWQSDLWYLSVAHAAQGVLDFLSFASSPFQQQSIATGAVFFPDGNRLVGKKGFDSRLQPWNRFPASMEWHPMTYAVCGNTSCVVEEVKRVINKASPQTKVIPAIAGVWGKSYRNHLPLEVQMQAIQKAVPQINSLSHFAYSWLEPRLDHQRRFCRQD